MQYEALSSTHTTPFCEPFAETDGLDPGKVYPALGEVLDDTRLKLAVEAASRDCLFTAAASR